ncbi:T-cell surface glycoprotein CD8 alpha chain isoform X2 [Hyperolius riggenbachi]|uniref:T-cell surface glycoprotein CD8 alpha chain isoform X2 n=1 Tax=Hyperolius riggenbachi TaxID=752182 RepID=UPI0035A26B78
MREDFSRIMKGNLMGLIPPLLILLCLFPGSLHLKLKGPELQKRSDQEVTLACSADSGESLDTGVFWLRQRKSTQYPESIGYVSSVGKTTYKDKGSERFKLGKEGTLSTNLFQEDDQGTYYCMINKNSVLSFSPGLKLNYPEVTTPKPRITKPPPVNITTKGSQTANACDCSSGNTESTDKKTGFWDLNCDINIWAPLAVLCAFLLICLTITSILLCCRKRKRSICCM